MDKAEEYFWKNLPKHNLTSQNVIDRNKVNFDDIIELMDKYAQQVSREVAIEFVFNRYTSRTPIIANGSTAVKAHIEKNYKDWQQKQEKDK
ncbi:hypothetical protein ES705_36810 [subsurface metagenome]